MQEQIAKQRCSRFANNLGVFRLSDFGVNAISLALRCGARAESLFLGKVIRTRKTTINLASSPS